MREEVKQKGVIQIPLLMIIIASIAVICFGKLRKD